MAQVKSLDTYYQGVAQGSTFGKVHDDARSLRKARSIRVAIGNLFAVSFMFMLLCTILYTNSLVVTQQQKITVIESNILDASRKKETMTVEILKSKNYEEIKKKVMSSEFKESSMNKGIAIDLSKDNFPEYGN